MTSSPHVCLCSTKTCPTTGWTGWASRPPCTGTRTAPGPCRRCTSTMGPSCTLTSTRTPPTPTPCPPVWAHRLTTLSREIKTRYTGRCEAAVRGHAGWLAGWRAGVCYPGWRGTVMSAADAESVACRNKNVNLCRARDCRAEQS